MLRNTKAPNIYMSCGILCVEPLIHQQDHYQLLKSSLLLLLNIFNKIPIFGYFPSDSRKDIIVPIPKPDNDPAYEARTSLDWDGNTKCLLNVC